MSQKQHSKMTLRNAHNSKHMVKPHSTKSKLSWYPLPTPVGTDKHIPEQLDRTGPHLSPVQRLQTAADETHEYRTRMSSVFALFHQEELFPRT